MTMIKNMTLDNLKQELVEYFKDFTNEAYYYHREIHSLSEMVFTFIYLNKKQLKFLLELSDRYDCEIKMDTVDKRDLSGFYEIQVAFLYKDPNWKLNNKH